MIESESISQIIREVAERVTLPRVHSLTPDQVKTKSGPDNQVTIADIETEDMLAALLCKAVPGSLVLGEEAFARDPGAMRSVDGDAPVWIIDPIDGTINFANADPGFGTIVAYVERGRTVAGWIHLPVDNLTVHARRGGGAWCGGRRLTTAAERPLSVTTGAAFGVVRPIGMDALAAIGEAAAPAASIGRRVAPWSTSRWRTARRRSFSMNTHCHGTTPRVC